jgi:hypothetical protein
MGRVVFFAWNLSGSADFFKQYTTIKRRTTINKKNQQQKHMQNNQAGGGEGILCTGFYFWVTLVSLSLLDFIFVHGASQQLTIFYNKNNTKTTNTTIKRVGSGAQLLLLYFRCFCFVNSGCFQLSWFDLTHQPYACAIRLNQ